MGHQAANKGMRNSYPLHYHLATRGENTLYRKVPSKGTEIVFHMFVSGIEAPTTPVT